MNSKILKELFIILLLIIVIMFAFSILFYDCISADNEKISSIEYIVDTEVNKTLKEIQQNSGVDIESESSDYLLKSYSINKEDLTIYASENSYESGKTDPFAESSEPIEELITTTTTNPEKTNSELNDSVILENNSENVENTTTKNEEVPTNEIKTKNESKNTVSNTSNSIEEKSTVGTFFENKSSK